MSTERLKRAAERMRREDTPFLHAVADMLMEAAMYRGIGGTVPFVRNADEAAEAYLSDPGDLPAVPE